MDEVLEDAYDKAEMEDGYPSTDESDVDTFLEYAREVIAENNLSYDSTSFMEFENLLQECIANHFLDSNGDHNDSMTSDSSYSGYLNDESNSGSRKKTALLQKKGIMSDNTYYRMKGIIARKKSGSTIYWNQSSTSEDIDTTMTTSASNHDISSYSFQNQSESDATNNEYFINDLMLSKMNSMSSFSQRCDSDSSDSLVDKTAMRQIRRKKNRKRAKKEKTVERRIDPPQWNFF